MKFSIVIPTCDRPDALRACLELLAPGKQKYPPEEYEVIVSDDGRRLAARSSLAEDFPKVLWVDGPRRGPAANRNAGAGRATGEVLVFLDDDCLPESTLLSGYGAFFSGPGTDAAEGRIRTDRPRMRMDEEAPVNESGGCFWSCNVAMRREFFVNIGGFDERFPAAAMEDVELRERIRRAGVEIRFVPEASVIHPLRLMGGWSYVRRRAVSHGIYVLIPGCHLPPPSYRSAVWSTLRVLRKRFFPGLAQFRGRGALRASRLLLLPLWSAYEMKKALRLARMGKARGE